MTSSTRKMPLAKSWAFWRWNSALLMMAGLFLGIAAGLLLRAASADLSETLLSEILLPLGGLFLRLIVMTTVPLVFCAVVLGVVELGDGQSLGRLGLKTLLAATSFAAVSIVIALSLVNFVHPGTRLSSEQRAALVADYGSKHAHRAETPAPAQKKPFLANLVELVPDNPLVEAVNALRPQRNGGGMIGVIVFALATGCAMRAAGPAAVRPLRDVCDAVLTCMMRIIAFAMRLAPACVFCLMAVTSARLGVEMFVALGHYMITVLGGLAISGLVFFPLVLRYVVRTSPLAFFGAAREAIVTAFSTASSGATMPVAMRVAETRLDIPRPIARFVVVLGAACNHNGTALYEAVTVLFLAQVFGLDLSLSLQLQVALLCMMSSIGAGGVPGGGLAMTVTVMASIGLPVEAIGLVMGLDRILDMSRTALNVTGDLVIAKLVSPKTILHDTTQNALAKTGA